MANISIEDSIEQTRLELLNSLYIMETLPEQSYDDLVRLAAQVTQSPLALITFIDHRTQWFKAKVGTTLEATPKHLAFCNHVISSGDPVIVPNTTLDPRFAPSPLVTAAPFVRFYAGFPLITREGYVVGSLCVLDVVAKELTRPQIESLEALARQINLLLELRRKGHELQRHLSVTTPA